MRLTDLRNGEKAVIVNVHDGRGVDRLLDFGVIPGTEIECITSYPFGGPLLLKVGASHIAIGLRMARGIEIARKS